MQVVRIEVVWEGVGVLEAKHGSGSSELQGQTVHEIFH